MSEEDEARPRRPSATARLERETTEVEAAVLLVASGRAVSVTVTDVPEAALVLDRLTAWADELGVELVRVQVVEGPEAILVRRRR